MAKNSIDAYGASGKTNLLFFDPDVPVLVTDKLSPLYDELVHLPEHKADYEALSNAIAYGVDGRGA